MYVSITYTRTVIINRTCSLHRRGQFQDHNYRYVDRPRLYLLQKKHKIIHSIATNNAEGKNLGECISAPRNMFKVIACRWHLQPIPKFPIHWLSKAAVSIIAQARSSRPHTTTRLRRRW